MSELPSNAREALEGVVQYLYRADRAFALLSRYKDHPLPEKALEDDMQLDLLEMIDYLESKDLLDGIWDNCFTRLKEELNDNGTESGDNS